MGLLGGRIRPVCLHAVVQSSAALCHLQPACCMNEAHAHALHLCTLQSLLSFSWRWLLPVSTVGAGWMQDMSLRAMNVTSVPFCDNALTLDVI